MNIRMIIYAGCLISILFLVAVPDPVCAQVITKAQVSDKIKKVEDGTDEFIDYLERRGENARTRASTPQSQDKRKRRSEAAGTSTEARKSGVEEGKDDLEDAVKDLGKATDRLRRRFKRVQNYLDTKVQVEKVVDEGRDLNQIVTRGNYGSEVARVWAALRVTINDLARVYGVKPLVI